MQETRYFSPSLVRPPHSGFGRYVILAHIGLDESRYFINKLRAVIEATPNCQWIVSTKNIDCPIWARFKCPTSPIILIILNETLVEVPTMRWKRLSWSSNFLNKIRLMKT